MPYPPGAEEERTRTPASTRLRAIRVIRGRWPEPFWISNGSSSDLPLCLSRLCGAKPSGSTTETRWTQRVPRREGRGRSRCRGQNGCLTSGNRPSRSHPNLLFTKASHQTRERLRRKDSPVPRSRRPPSRSLQTRPITPSPPPHPAQPTGRRAATNVRCHGLTPLPSRRGEGAQAHDWSFSPLTRPNSRQLFVTSVRPFATACPAISRS